MDSNTLHFWITEEKVNEIVERFIKSKDKKFQGKAIISRDTAEDVIRVLKQVKGNNRLYGTASFRFWARKRFIVKEIDDKDVVCCKSDTKHKPVCLKEDIYETVLKAHIDCNHRGKDSTYKQIHRTKSFLPKSLVELIVKECIHCNLKKESKKVEFYDIVDIYFDL